MPYMQVEFFANMRWEYLCSCLPRLQMRSWDGTAYCWGSLGSCWNKQSFSGAKAKNPRSNSTPKTQKIPLRLKLKQTNAFMSFCVSLCPKMSQALVLDLLVPDLSRHGYRRIVSGLSVVFQICRIPYHSTSFHITLYHSISFRIILNL